MKSYYALTASLMLMTFGEILTIYCELHASRLPGDLWSTPGLLIKPVLLICVAGVSLVVAYWLGYRATGNIWVITVTSLTLLLVLEPIVIYVMLGELPGRGATLGFVLGALGLLCTLLL